MEELLGGSTDEVAAEVLSYFHEQDSDWILAGILALDDDDV